MTLTHRDTGVRFYLLEEAGLDYCEMHLCLKGPIEAFLEHNVVTPPGSSDVTLHRASPVLGRFRIALDPHLEEQRTGILALLQISFT